MAAWGTAQDCSRITSQQGELVPLSCTLIAMPLASAFSLPGSTPAPQPHLRSLHSTDTRVPTQPSSSHRGTGDRTTSTQPSSHGCMLELSSGGRPSTSTDMRDTGPTPTQQPSNERQTMSGGQPQISAGAAQPQQTTSQSQQPTHPTSSDHYRQPQSMPSSSYQSGAHSLHVQHMMQAAAAYHNMQQSMGQGMQGFPQQAPSMSGYGSGYGPYVMGPYGMMGGPADYAAQQQMYRHLTGAQGSLSAAQGHHQAPHEVGDDDDAGARAIKRPRLVWTPQLHKRFEEAIAKLGDAKAVPKNIMQEMNVEGLTRENVASHLQKYRLQNKGSGSLLDAPGETTSQ